MSRAPRVVPDTSVALSALMFLVTSDHDLLSLACGFSCPLVPADRFLNVLAKT
jgi:hypothetical protein